MKVLVLGGTAEARALATALAGMGQDVVISLAGRTANPLLPEGGTVRSGGFGGAEGLAAYIAAEGIGRVVDATHPYAVTISEHAVAATAETGTPLVRLIRPGWVEPKDAYWFRVPTFEAAAELLSLGSRALLTIGHRGLEPFFAREDCTFLIRAIEMPDWLPPHCWIIQSRPPYFVRAETQLMVDEKITHLVTKDSGGVQTEAKLIAAQTLKLPVLIIDRPQKVPAPECQSIGRCIAMLHLERG